ncbi:ABC transporter permease [Aliifodinibius sp. S!AR15-10]|uniref:ABC transporter permease n=1 Tax=Aliifodinibius sp. S!AR15-10 TaxID=2950437 RepID=UPI002863BA09|nr:ABC transporter permease [Aliifodinibius sp. S!AR15-10]MDR8393449.1 ABC transporter permease [Aliifodinibius sp. S!AR15-10]
MFKNYIKIAWRNFKRDKSYSLINTAGLVIALSAFIVIGLFVYDELSYDDYHEDADQIYRVYKAAKDGDANAKSLATANLLAPTLEREITGLEEVTRISKRFAESLVESRTQKRYVDGLFLTDPSLFDVFNFSFIRGNPDTALNRAFTVVLTKSAARRYFGNQNPIGKSIWITSLFGKEEYEVTGVIADIPENSHYTFELLTSLETLRKTSPEPENDFGSWGHVGTYTYVKLQEGITQEEVAAQFPEFLTRHQGKRAQNMKMALQPVTDIHLYSNFRREIQPNSDIRYVYIFSSVALLILLIAGINYANLAMAKSADRAREVGIHKTLGMSKYQIIIRFLAESFVLCSISVVLAFCLSEALLPLFNNLTGKDLSLFDAPAPFYIILLLFTLVFSLSNGLYPAVAFSRHNPGRILNEEASAKKKSLLRNGLIVFQFTIAVVLIVSTLIIDRQLEYVNNKRLGLNEEQVVNVNAGDGRASDYQVFRDQLTQYPSIKNITFTGAQLPATDLMAMCLYPTGGQRGDTKMLGIGPNFLRTLEIPLLMGQSIDGLSFSRENDFFPVLINEAAMEKFGWEDDPIGQTFECFSPTPTVVGVVGDFHYESLKKEIEPLVLMGSISAPRNILIRVESESIRATLDRIEQVWDEVGPGTPFVYSFMDENYENLYKAEDKLASLFSYFTVLAIAIGCLGLFGLSAYTAERRTKEIGIRKVLGATVTQIVGLLSKDFLKLVLIGFTIAVPIAWYAMNRWLQDFAYRIEIGPGIFLLAGSVAVFIALATVSWQSIRVALVNPVESLRSE